MRLWKVDVVLVRNAPQAVRADGARGTFSGLDLVAPHVTGGFLPLRLDEVAAGYRIAR